MFQLVTITGGEPVPVLDADGKPFLFQTGSEAAEAALKASQERGEKVQPRRVADEDAWREREARRFEDGTYQHVPFKDEPWFFGSAAWGDHFLHISTERADMVAYTEDAAKGAADRQTRVKIGVYLTRYFRDVLTLDQIRDIATNFTAEREENTVLFAQTADDIQRVYEEGPHSCMQYDESHFDSECHPVRVYAAGDLQVAYLEIDENITARALVWPEKKLAGRIYGDATRLRHLLQSLGYATDSPLDGARLLRIPAEDGRFVAPYIDYSLHVRDRGDFLIIDKCGDIECTETDGFSKGEEQFYCELCAEHRPVSQMAPETVSIQFILGTVEVDCCQGCYENDTFTCDYTGDRYSNSLGVDMANGETWSVGAFEEAGFICDATGENWPLADRVEMAGGEAWCREHFEEHGFTCPDCWENFPKEEGVEVGGRMLCPECAEKAEADQLQLELEPVTIVA